VPVSKHALASLPSRRLTILIPAVWSCGRSPSRRECRWHGSRFAWVLSRGEDTVPLIGARRRDRLAQALGALNLPLDAGDLAAIAETVPSRRRG
jgi:hypothetical protein